MPSEPDYLDVTQADPVPLEAGDKLLAVRGEDVVDIDPSEFATAQAAADAQSAAEAAQATAVAAGAAAVQAGTDASTAQTTANAAAAAAASHAADTDKHLPAPVDDRALVREAGAWVLKTYAQLKTLLGLTKSDVGLGSVDNTPDVDKPVSAATQAALDLKPVLGETSATAYRGDRGKASYDHIGDADKHLPTPVDDRALVREAGAWVLKTYAQFKTLLGLTKSDVGLGNVDNTSDANKPLSLADKEVHAGKVPSGGRRYGTSGTTIGATTSINGAFALGGTILARICPFSCTGYNRILSSKSATEGWDFELNTLSGGQTGLWFDHLFSGTAMRVSCTSGVRLNQISAVAVTWDGSNAASGAALYINGVAQTIASVDGVGTRSADTQSRIIGNRPALDSTYAFDGLIVEVLHLNAVLTAAEIATWATFGVLPAWTRQTGSMVTPVAPGTLNGGFETAGGGGADVFASISESTSGSSTLTRDTTDYSPNGGAASCRMTTDSSGSGVSIRWTGVVVPGTTYMVRFEAKRTGGELLALTNGAQTVSYASITPAANWTAYSVLITANDSDLTMKRATAAPSSSIWIDNVTIVPVGNCFAALDLSQPILRTANGLSIVEPAGGIPLWPRATIYASSVGPQSIFLDARAWTLPASGGPAEGSIALATAGLPVQTLDFDAVSAEVCYLALPMPKAWNGGTLTFIPRWAHGTAAAYGVVWQLRARAISDGEALDGSWGTAVTSADTGGTSGTLYIGPESAAMTPGGSTPARGDLLLLELSRQPTNGSDTMNVDARLVGIDLRLTVDAGSEVP